ncbi:MAG: FkbM family methyltransferase [Planctomycetota bacterium]
MSTRPEIPPRSIFADLRSIRNVYIDRRIPFAQRRRLVRDFVAMRLRSVLAAGRPGPVEARILSFSIRAFDYETLLFLFDEIYVFQCYRVELSRVRPLILDCGANIGMATLFFKSMAPDARIIAFEPDPATFALLTENVAGNRLSDVDLVNAALWKEEGRIDFHAGDEPGGLMMSAHPARLQGKRVEVDAVPLSRTLKEHDDVDLVKLDVEGAEQEIVTELDASGTLGSVREWIIEYHHRIGAAPSRLSRFLEISEKWGYEYQLDARGHRNEKGQFPDITLYAYR